MRVTFLRHFPAGQKDVAMVSEIAIIVITNNRQLTGDFATVPPQTLCTAGLKMTASSVGWF